MVLVFMNSIYLILFGGIMPYDSYEKNMVEIFNEVMQMILGYHMFLFTDFVIDSVTKFKLGYSFLFILGLMAAVNLGLLLKNGVTNKLKWRRLTKIREANIKER
jgi:hypothetical protein